MLIEGGVGGGDEGLKFAFRIEDFSLKISLRRYFVENPGKSVKPDLKEEKEGWQHLT